MKGVGVRAGSMHTVYDANANTQFPLWCEEWGPEIGSLYRLSVDLLYFNYYYVPSEEWEPLDC
jgi:hypothetical protein